MKLETVKVGDPIVLVTNTGRSILKVSRVTKLHILVNGVKYKISSGRHVGGSVWDVSFVEVATPELMAEVRAENKRRKLEIQVQKAISNFNGQKYTDETLNALIALLAKTLPND